MEMKMSSELCKFCLRQLEYESYEIISEGVFKMCIE
jgi:hypothetical protein